MEIRIRKVGDEYGVILPKPLMDQMSVVEGSLLNVESHDGVLHMTPVDAEFTRQVEAFLHTEGEHRRSYRELAK